VRRLAERAAKLPAEVGGRQPCGASQVGHRERIEVPGIGKVLGPQQVTGRRHHPPKSRGSVADLVVATTSDHMLYHMVMGRREVLVQLDEDLVDRLDRLAKTEGVSRSELLRRGAAAVLDAAELHDADRALQDAYRRVPQDPALVETARRLAAQTAPEW